MKRNIAVKNMIKKFITQKRKSATLMTTSKQHQYYEKKKCYPKFFSSINIIIQNWKAGEMQTADWIWNGKHE